MSIKIIIAGVAALAVVGGGSYYALNANSNGESSQSSREAAQTEEQSTFSKASLKELLARGDSLECSFSHTDDSDNRTVGTFYISNENMRGDFSYKQGDGQPTKYGMIRNSDTVYTWDKTKNEGFKMNYSDYESSEDEQVQEGFDEQAIDQDQQYDFDCSDWSVEASKFDTPEGVKFTDISAQLDNIRQQSQGTQEQTQNACAQIADPQVREACEKNL